jgi:transcriptional regulator with XRE-family HTH domain
MSSKVLEKSLVKEFFNPSQALTILRSNLHLTQANFARIIGYTSRSVASWERGNAMAMHALRAIKEFQNIYDRACNIAPKEEVARWFKTPNKELGGISPFDAISAGRTADVLRLIILAEEGIPT